MYFLVRHSSTTEFDSSLIHCYDNGYESEKVHLTTNISVHNIGGWVDVNVDKEDDRASCYWRAGNWSVWTRLVMWADRG